MATYSTNLALTLMATGEQSNTWGDTTNTNLGTLLEQAISGYVTQAITDGSSANTTITIPNGATGVARNMFIEMTGALTFSTTSLIVPANKKLYFIYNNTTGGFAVTVKVSGQTGVSVPNGKKMVLVSNGTDIVNAENYIASLSVGALTSGRVPYAGTSGLLQDSANLTFNGTTLTAAGFSGPISGVITSSSITDSGLTSGRVTYAGTAGLLQDSANLTFNGTTLTANTIGAFTLSGTVAGGGNQLNNVIIGTTTPLAGAFTTLSATGDLTLSGTVGRVVSNANSKRVLIAGGSSASTTTGAYAIFEGYDYGGAGAGGAISLVSAAGTTNPISMIVGGTTRGVFSSTGLDVTGTLSATGAVTSGTDFKVPTLGYIYAYTGAGAGTVKAGFQFDGAGAIYGKIADTTITNTSSTGLAVTGTLSATGTLSGGTSGTGYSFSGSAAAGSLTLNSSGNVGIGTASPDASFKFTVSGNSGAVTPGIYFVDQASSPKNYVLYTNGTKDFVLRSQTDGINIWTANSTGLAVTGTLSSTLDATIYGVTVGRGGGAVSTNTAVGSSALNANTSGVYNTAMGRTALLTSTSSYCTAIGAEAGYSNTTGLYLTAVGAYALYGNTTGQGNSALGVQAVELNTTGSFNTGIGRFALRSNTTASNNTAVGYQAGYSNTTGSNNTMLGNQAGFSATTGVITAVGSEAAYSANGGDYVVAVGYQSLRSNTTGDYNTAIGTQALFANTTASNNTAVGYQAGYSHTNGTLTAFGNKAAYANTTADQTTAIGNLALTANTTGPENTAVGAGALYTNTTGGYNVALGRSALLSNTTASNNTAVGYQAGYSNTTGTYQTFVGYTAGHDTTGTNSTFVGQGAGYFVTTGAKNTILGQYNGNQNGLDIRTASNYIVLSDGDGNPLLYLNDKTNAQWNLNAPTGASYSGVLSFALATAIKAQIYYQNSVSNLYVQNTSGGVYLTSGGTSWTGVSDERFKDIIEPISDAVTKVSSLRAVIGKFKTDEKNVRRSFLIAQDVEAVLPEAVDKSNPEQLGLAYSDVIPLLVAAIKELSAKVTALENK